MLFFAALLTAGTVANAQTTIATTTPTVPSTGQGGNMLVNILILGSSALIAVAGVTYLIRKSNSPEKEKARK